MKTSRYQMIERADEFRTLAQGRRNRGLHTGKAAKGWNFQRPKLDPADFQSHVVVAADLWRMDKADALNDFRADCLNGPAWEHDYVIPF